MKSQKLIFRKPSLSVLVVLAALAVFLFGSSASVEARGSKIDTLPPQPPVRLRAMSAVQGTQATHFVYLPMVFTNKPDGPVPVGPLGGTFTALAVDPGQNDNIYAGSFDSGIYKSFDKGVSWYRKSAGLTNLKIQSLATHPTSSLIVYAGTYEGGVFKSSDAGEHWIAANGGVLNGHIVYDIEIDPANPNTLYVVTRLKSNLVGYLYRSVNGGASWALLLSGESFDIADYFYDIDIQPAHSNVLFLSTHTHGIYKSTNSGASFFPVNTNITDLSTRSTVLDPAFAGLVYTGVWHGEGVYVSWNGGVSWQKSSAGLPVNVRVMGVTLDPFGRTQKRVFAYTFGNGLFSSDNFGGAWVTRGLAGQSLNDFFVADGNPQRWYAATQDNGIYRSSTYGQSWIGSNGTLRLNNITGIVQGMKGEDDLYVSIYGRGVFQVTQSATSWVELNMGLGDLEVVSLADVDGTLMAITRSGLFQLKDEVWTSIGNLPPGTVSGSPEEAAFLSERTAIHAEYAEDTETSVSLESDFMNNSGGVPVVTSMVSFGHHFYAGTLNSGLFMLEDSSWSTIAFAGRSVYVLAMDDAQSTLAAAVCSAEMDCEIARFDGAAWTTLGEVFRRTQVFSLKQFGSTLFAATEQGLFRWEESDQAWKNELSVSVPIYALAGFPGDGCRIAASGQGVVFWTADCGQTWQRYAGLLEDWRYQEIGFDSLDENLLLLGSKEAGAFTINLEN